MIACALLYLAGNLFGPYCILFIASTCLMGALLRVIIPVLIMDRRLAHLPGPPPHRLISGHGEYFRRVIRSKKYTIMFDIWLEWSKKYGPVFHYRHYHKHAIPIVYGPEPIKRVLQDVDNIRYIFKDSLKFYNGIRMLGDDGMLLSPYNDKWRIKKTILRQFLNPGSVPKYEDKMLLVVDRSLSSLAKGLQYSSEGRKCGGREVNVLEFVQAITSDVMGLCLFNKDFGCSLPEKSEYSDLAQNSSQISNECFKMIADPKRKLPFIKTAVKRDTCRKIIKIRQMARGIIENGSPLTDQFVKAFDNVEDIIDDINSILFAGQDTTSNIITYALANISHDQKVNKWLREELDPLSGSAAWSEIQSLPRLNAVIKETLRLYPSAPVTLRTLHKDHDICGHNIPAGSTVWISPYTAARHSSSWEHATSFRPQRFIDAQELPKCQYFPFMAGPHECSGKHLALMELKLVLFRIMKRFRLRLLNHTIPPPQMSITLHPSKPIRISFTEFGD